MKGGGFSIKAAKKTPFQRHKELEEEKKRRADEEAAKVYEEFVESFKADEPDDRRGSGAGVKAFVRGGVVTPGSRPQEAPAGAKGGKYVPSFVPPALGGGGGSSSASRSRPEPGRVAPRHDAFADEEEEEESVFKPPKKQDKDKPRQIDRMLEQLKREQEEREERERLRREGKPVPPERPDPHGGGGDRGGWGGGGGSYDDSDPYTTNLYVGNIHPEVNEAHLAREFGRFGPIGSVKIMWPRDEEQRRRGRNCGFVAFMTRPDAEEARRALDGLELHGMPMHIGWGRAVPLPPVPLYSGTGVPTGPLTAVVPPAVTRERADPVTLAMQSALMPAVGVYARESTQARSVVKGTGPDIEVRMPGDARLRFVIDSLALYVLKDGAEFEQAAMMEMQDSPDFAFLFDLGSPEHAYYRWRLYSLAEGDTLRTWRIDPFLLVEGGQAWLPPPMLAADVAAAAADKGGRGGGGDHGGGAGARGGAAAQLSDADRDRLEDLLRGLTAEREAIAEAMLFALDHADAAADVVELARLYLAHDILANATAPVRNASRYRVRLEAVLPDVFASFHAAYRAAGGRLAQEALRRPVLRLLRLWRERFMFNADYVNGLQATMLGHIPALEQAEEAELLQRQAAEAAAKAAAAAAAREEARRTRSRWEADDDDGGAADGDDAAADAAGTAARALAARAALRGRNLRLRRSWRR
ncbi:RRC1 [Scenedesmus sp. PABB004]|nr:RRC1 [Scenedesmus sp. PABB004]